MTRYLLRRLPVALVTLVLASFAVFVLIRLVPGDPVATLAGPDASPEARAAIAADLGLDRPLLAQFGSWWGDLLQGHLGRSYVVGGSVSDLVLAGAANTLVLTAAALLLAITGALLAGIAPVLWDNPLVRAVTAVVNTLAVAVPTFALGLVLVLGLAILVPVLPAGGTPPEGFWARPDISVQYLLLPAVCLAAAPAAALSRFLTESLRSELEQPYVLTARALGLSRRRIVLTQALPNALPAALTVLGLQVGTLLGGAVLVEAVFAWPGLGALVEEAISARDYPLVQVLLLLSVAVFVVVQLTTDVLHAWLDPRIRIGGAS